MVLHGAARLSRGCPTRRQELGAKPALAAASRDPHATRCGTLGPASSADSSAFPPGSGRASQAADWLRRGARRSLEGPACSGEPEPRPSLGEEPCSSHAPRPCLGEAMKTPWVVMPS